MHLSSLKTLMITLLLIALPVFPILKNLEGSEMDSLKTFIVEFKDKPLATYQGDRAGYPATSPSITGKKLDFKRSEVVLYRKFLEQQKSVYLEAIRKRLKRNPEVLQSYDVSFFGISIRLELVEALAIKRIPGIKQIRPDEIRTLLNGQRSKE